MAAASLWWLLTDLSVWSLALTALCVILWSNSRAMIAEYGPDAERDLDESPASSSNAHKDGKRRSKKPRRRAQDEAERNTNTISMTKAILFPIVGSVVLLVLFFLLNIVKYIFLILISLSSLLSLTIMFYDPWSTLLMKISHRWTSFPSFIRCMPQNGATVTISDEVQQQEALLNDVEDQREESEEEDDGPIDNEGVVSLCGPERVQRGCVWLCHDKIGLSYFPISLVTACGTAVTLLLLWYTTNHWVVLNALAICMAVTSLTSLRIQSIKVALVFLILFFLYDIFWVFLSSYFFKESVMESVARNVSSSGSGGIDLPILIRFPKLGNGEIQGLATHNYMFIDRPCASCLGPGVGLFSSLSRIFRTESLGFMMLGLGDIILPGVFINFLRRFDYERGYRWWPTGYSTVGLVGYMTGLFMTFFALIILRRGQPALLYLVPCCLIPVSIIAWRYGDLKLMWTGLQDESETQPEPDLQGDPPHSPHAADSSTTQEEVTT
eukprot:TRINITY_DN15462_c0_g1_i1.p1 TRINITY_DN15462_c0_g1~~TRINITY_DN15462_c0_g1_i1.p1  ORF type:complete len:496 (+),score=59.72 TRINITY_DN15462_c0_g1_i1:61-1548(+)